MALMLAALTAAGLLTLAGPAGSAEAAASCQGRKVRTLTFDAGTIKVYRKGRRHVCAVLMPEKAGKGKRAFVKMRPRGGKWAMNTTHPTGPVIVHAGKRRVWIHARVGSVTYDSGWILR
jgi:hypothetical protein